MRRKEAQEFIKDMRKYPVGTGALGTRGESEDG